jgi:hypothetical protein
MSLFCNPLFSAVLINTRLQPGGKRRVGQENGFNRLLALKRGSASQAVETARLGSFRCHRAEARC